MVASTTASARSTPAVSPAEVHMLPSRVKMPSSMTRARGYRVLRSPDEFPVRGGAALVEDAASPKTNAPVQMDITRGMRRWWRRNHDTS